MQEFRCVGRSEKARSKGISEIVEILEHSKSCVGPKSKVDKYSESWVVPDL